MHAGLVPLSSIQVYSQPFHEIDRIELMEESCWCIRNPIKHNFIEEVFTDSFHAARFKVQVDRYNITLLAMYHPLYSAINPVTEKMFIDEFNEWICDQVIISEHGNKLLILGNFNIQVYYKFDKNAGNFMDIIMALGHKQHIHFPTHKAGKSLDLYIHFLLPNWK